MNARLIAPVSDVDPKDAAYVRLCERYGVVPEPTPHKAVAFAALQGERQDDQGGWDAWERRLIFAHLRRRPRAPLRPLRPRAPRPDAPIGEPVKMEPAPLGADPFAELHARREAGEDLATGELARALGVSVPAAHAAYQSWCAARGLAPLPGYRGRSSWAPWIVERYLSGYEPAEIAAALTGVSTYAYPEAQVERILEALRVAVNPLHRALRVKV